MNAYAAPTRKISTISSGNMAALFTEREPLCKLESDRFYDRQLAADLRAAERALDNLIAHAEGVFLVEPYERQRARKELREYRAEVLRLMGVEVK